MARAQVKALRTTIANMHLLCDPVTKARRAPSQVDCGSVEGSGKGDEALTFA
jgi:hypothetical protein